MVYTCCVPNCYVGYKPLKSEAPPSDNRGTPAVMFRFPYDKGMRERWIRTIGRRDFHPNENHRVCSLHFTTSDFITVSQDTNNSRNKDRQLKRLRLKPYAVPHIFPSCPTYLSTADVPTRQTKYSSSLAQNENERIKAVNEKRLNEEASVAIEIKTECDAGDDYSMIENPSMTSTEENQIYEEEDVSESFNEDYGDEGTNAASEFTLNLPVKNETEDDEESSIDDGNLDYHKDILAVRPTTENDSNRTSTSYQPNQLAETSNGVAYIVSNNFIHPVQLSMSVSPTSTLRDIKFSWRYLYNNVLNNEEVCIRWLAGHGLLPNERCCPICESVMVVARQWTCWRCRHCKKGFSVRKDSFFYGEHLSFTTIIELLYWWSLDFKQSVISRELEISNQTVVRWFHRLRKVCELYFQDHPYQLGGPGKEVEIGESVFSTYKSQGESDDTQWILGMVERGNSDAFFTVIPDRNTETMLPIIERYVRPGTRIITDAWRSYVALPNHVTVNRSLHFVDPDDRTVHTNTVEGVWRHVKDDLLRRKKGVRKELLEAHLREIQWRRLMGYSTFAEMLYWLDFYRI